MIEYTWSYYVLASVSGNPYFGKDRLWVGEFWQPEWKNKRILISHIKFHPAKTESSKTYWVAESNSMENDSIHIMLNWILHIKSALSKEKELYKKTEGRLFH